MECVSFYNAAGLACIRRLQHQKLKISFISSAPTSQTVYAADVHHTANFAVTKFEQALAKRTSLIKIAMH